MAIQKTIMANDIVKGMKVTLRDGTIVTVNDAKKGVIRNVITPTSFGTSSIGDDYIYKWKEVEINGELYKVTFTPDQQKRISNIRSAGF
jgi:hypothetical protein